MMVPLLNSRGEFLQRPLVAVIDLLYREQDGLVVNEFKTSGRRFAVSEADNALQASAYVHAIHHRYDEAARVRYTVLVKTKTPGSKTWIRFATDDDLGGLVTSPKH